MERAGNFSLPRTIHVMAAVVVGLAVVGFLLGTSPPGYSPAPPTATSAPTKGAALLGRTYAELRDRRFGPNTLVTSDPQELRVGLPAAGSSTPRTTPQLQAALAFRAERRAYDGAPPVVPHPIDELSAQSCIVCHGAGMIVAGKIAPVLSHPFLASCTQCHISTFHPGAKVAATTVANTFEGYRGPALGSRAWTGAPPTIPHATFMHDSCSSCHGLTGRPGLRTPHPQRKSCTQCHVPDYSLERFNEPR
jgi:nitrate reductase (cytochrome), electron transfer subunit